MPRFRYFAGGVWLKKKLGIKLIYDAHEIFGYMIKKQNKKFIVNKVFDLEKKWVESVDYIITLMNLKKIL